MTTSIEAITAIIGVFISACAFSLSLFVIFSERWQKKLDNPIAIQEFPRYDDLSDARQWIREGTLAISLATPEVRRVCSSFNFAGVLVRYQAISKAIFLDYWGSMLEALDRSFAGFGGQPTGTGIRVCEYYKDLWWLKEEAKRRVSK